MKVKTPQPKHRRDFEGMKAHAYNQWELLIDAAGGSHLTTGKHMACPFNDCGSEKDGFRYTNIDGGGEWICSGKGNQHSGDGFDIVAELQGSGSSGAYDMVRQILGEPYSQRITGSQGNGRTSGWTQPGGSFQGAVKSGIEDNELRERLTHATMTAGEFNALEIEPPERVCGPIHTEGLTIFAGAGGVGKSWLGMALATSIHSGRDWCHWEVPRARKVLHIDTEMPPGLIHMRSTALDPGITVINRYTWAKAGLGRFNLLDEAHADFAVATAKEHEFVILDNAYSAAIPTEDTKGSTAEFWQAVYSFYHRISLEGVGLILIDHLGRTGTLQGSINKEWSADLFVKLSTPSHYIPLANQFQIELDFAKQRNGWEPKYMKDPSFSFINGFWSPL